MLLREPYDYRKENLFCGNRYKLCDDYYEVECFDKTIFKIDICDYDMVKDYVWHLSNNYIVGKVDKKEIKLHRFLLSPTKEEEIDHKDRDTLNNRRNNLRIISRSENCFNRGLQVIILLDKLEFISLLIIIDLLLKLIMTEIGFI